MILAWDVRDAFWSPKVVAVRDYASAIFPLTCAHRVMVMLTAYVDESGKRDHGGTSRSLVLGGYVASVEDWESFQAAWGKLLRRECLSDFHRAEMESFWRIPRLRHWTREHQVSVLRDCHAVIRDHVDRSGFRFAVALSYAEYDALLDEDRALVGSPYALCAKVCFDIMKDWPRRQGQQTKVIFDRGMPARGEIAAAIDPWAPEIKDGGREDRLEFNPLQAADFLAYEAWKLNESVMDGLRSFDEVRRSFQDMQLEDGRSSFWPLDEVALPQYIAHVRERGF